MTEDATIFLSCYQRRFRVRPANSQKADGARAVQCQQTRSVRPAVRLVQANATERVTGSLLLFLGAYHTQRFPCRRTGIDTWIDALRKGRIDVQTTL
jgi:hypothetical protein